MKLKVFVAPNMLKLDIKPNKKNTNFKLFQIHFNVPITPTKMRLIFYFYRNVAVFAKHIPGSNRLFRHFSDKVVDQDLELLVGQQVRLLQGAKAWNTAVSADTAGVLYRKFRDRAEKTNPWFGGFNSLSYFKKESEAVDYKKINPFNNIIGGNQNVCLLSFYFILFYLYY